MENAYMVGGLAFALVAIATSFGISWIASKAMDGTARQPEAAAAIRTSMIIAVAFVEAICLYGLVVSLILITK
jgi:F-type H+-transporting ATPase subunit c